MEAMIALGIVAAGCVAYCLWSVVAVHRINGGDDDPR